MDIHEQLRVPAEPQAVWTIMSDPQEVVSCVPGASLGERREDGSYDASATIKFGPVKVAFQAQVTLDMDDAAMSGRVTARGKDNLGGTRVASTMRFSVSAATGSGSTVAIDSEIELSGRLAGLIEGGASIVVSRMSAEFAANLASRCASNAHSGAEALAKEGDDTK